MLLGNTTEPPLRCPSDVLTNWDTIVQQVALDGGTVDPNTERRAAKREAYRSAILKGLSLLEHPTATGQWSLPFDFEVLMLEIDSLEGSGWDRTREIDGLIFWEGWGARCGPIEQPERIERRVRSGQEILSYIDSFARENLDVAGSWELGWGNGVPLLCGLQLSQG
jgi:hypothetical protein